MSFTPPLARLIACFQKLPGVGPKSAQRLAFYVLKQPSDDVQALSQSLLDAKTQVKSCQQCFNLTVQPICELCSQPGRNNRLVCVVAEANDLYALERTGEYKGLYHVLQGLISPLDGIGPDDIRLQELLRRLQPESPPEINPGINIDEVILALPPSVEGDTTSLYLSRLLQPTGVRISRIAFGLPVGSDLEYVDHLTISRALAGRQSV